jgi:NADH-quinone oxidoreductase subunit G
VASAHSTVEEQFYYKLIADRSQATVSMVSHYCTADGILQSEDRRPNLWGALVHGLIEQLPEPQLSGLAQQIQAGTIQTLLVVNEDVTELGISDDLLAKVKIIYVGPLANSTSLVANVVIPSLMVFEKDGSFINQSFRLQRFKAAIPGPKGIVTDFVVLEMMAALLGAEKSAPINIDAAWEFMAQQVPQFADDLRWSRIPEAGVALDPTGFLQLDFVESKNLKYDPIAFKETHAAYTGV